jgi:perosamine synthetase
MIPHNRPTLGPEEEAAATRAIRSGWLAQGKEVEAFETAFAGMHGLGGEHAVAVASGTAALFVALLTLGARGRRVAHPVYVCSAVRHAIRLAGGIPVPIDNAVDSPHSDARAMADARPDLAVAVHTYGIPADTAPLAGIPFIEDCAQALGSRADGRPTGLAGTAGVFSFYATKMITSGGQGGMLIARDASAAAAFRDYRQFDQRRDAADRFNVQMTDLQAAVGRTQLARLPDFLARRERIWSYYSAHGLPLLDAAPGSGRAPARYRAVLRAANPGEAISRLGRAGISAINPLEEWELLGAPADFPHAAALCRTTISLPIFPTLGEEGAKAVLAALEAP